MPTLILFILLFPGGIMSFPHFLPYPNLYFSLFLPSVYSYFRACLSMTSYTFKLWMNTPSNKPFRDQRFKDLQLGLVIRISKEQRVLRISKLDHASNGDDCLFLHITPERFHQIKSNEIRRRTHEREYIYINEIRKYKNHITTKTRKKNTTRCRFPCKQNINQQNRRYVKCH